MAPIDPLVLAKFVEALTGYYGAEPRESNNVTCRAWSNPWYNGEGQSLIFVSRSGFVRYGDVITNAVWMSEKSIQLVIDHKHVIPKRGLTGPPDPCLDALRTKSVIPQFLTTGETTMARKPAAEKSAAPKKAAAKTAPKKEAAPKKVAAPKVPREPGASGVAIDRGRYDNVVKSAKGRKSVNNGDALATALQGKTAAEVITVAKEVAPDKVKDWSHLNEGMQRMSAGNVIRSALKKAGVVVIDGKKIRAPVAA